MGTITITSLLTARECARRLDESLYRPGPSNLFGISAVSRTRGTIVGGSFTLSSPSSGVLEVATRIRGEIRSVLRGRTVLEIHGDSWAHVHGSVLVAMIAGATLVCAQHEGLAKAAGIGSILSLFHYFLRRYYWWSARQGEATLVSFVADVVNPPTEWKPELRPIAEVARRMPRSGSGRAEVLRSRTVQSQRRTALCTPARARPVDGAARCLVCALEVSAAVTHCDECGTSFHAHCRSPRCGVCGAPAA